MRHRLLLATQGGRREAGPCPGASADSHFDVTSPLWSRAPRANLQRTPEAHQALDAPEAHYRQRRRPSWSAATATPEIARVTGATCSYVDEHLTRARASLRLVAGTDHRLDPASHHPL